MKLTRRDVQRTVDKVQNEVAGRSPAFRLLWAMAGATIVIVGLALLLLPGPAVLVIAIGLAMLSAEFAWASRLLHVAIDVGFRAGGVIQNTTWSQRFIALAGLILFVAALGVLYLLQ